MPYIAITTSVDLNEAKMETLKTELGRLISIIPTKTEEHTMVDFSGSRTFYKAGKKVKGAFIEVRLFKKAEFEPKKKFTEEVLAMVSKELDIAEENFNMNILEFENWGSGGTFR